MTESKLAGILFIPAIILFLVSFAQMWVLFSYIGLEKGHSVMNFLLFVLIGKALATFGRNGKRASESERTAINGREKRTKQS